MAAARRLVGVSLWAMASPRGSAGAIDSARAVLRKRTVSRPRREELEALKGGRYVVSLGLEASDIAYPILRALISRAAALASFVLVSLIGQGIGLVARGIKLAITGGGRGGKGSKGGQRQRL